MDKRTEVVLRDIELDGPGLELGGALGFVRCFAGNLFQFLLKHAEKVVEIYCI